MYMKSEAILTRLELHAIPRSMGRKKMFSENINLTLPEGAKARMDAHLRKGEDRLSFIRTAIDAEIARRERQSPDDDQNSKA
ncbi:hypothetical protein [Sinorhizobium americanum]|uniref:hypothetical protein n=1 Tax=Sinorhizobium americanum TaxID=194963 RepID=UPI000565D5BD|nr:hypothetical protein [Sinorhizobium americanum]